MNRLCWAAYWTGKMAGFIEPAFGSGIYGRSEENFNI